MDTSSSVSRRGFVRLTASSAAIVPIAGFASPAHAQSSRSAADPWLGLKVGVASYSLSRLPLEAAIEGVRRVGVRYVSIKEAHLPLRSTTEERKAVVKQFRDAGITALSCGVVNMTDDESALHNAFEYARDAGIPTIVCKPTHQSLPVLDKLVKEFDLKLAIHNHGPEDKVWPSPLDVWKAIQKYDTRIGVCVDVGHTAAVAWTPPRRSAPAPLDSTTCISRTCRAGTDGHGPSRRGGAFSTSAVCSERCWISASPTMSAWNMRRT